MRAEPSSADAPGRLAQTEPPEVMALAELSRDPAWVLIEEGFTLAREHEVESLLAIGNGYVGNRASLAEGTPLSAPATFVAGVFEHDPKPGGVPGLFILPDWTGVRAWIDGHALSMDQGQILEHRRILDLRHGILWREWRHRDPSGRITRILAFRFASLADRHLLVQSVVFTPENHSGEVRFETCIELPPAVLAVGPPEEYKVRRSATRPNVLPLALRSPGRNITVAFGAASQMVGAGQDGGSREIEIGERRITERFKVAVEIGADYRLDRLVAIYTSRENAEPVAAAINHVNRILSGDIRSAVDAHGAAWQARWRSSDIEVEGDPALQRALRFAEYHLICAANPEDPGVSIGARALTGEAYKGHVFWDTEIYMVPFYSFTHPPSARALMLYRHHTLQAAREKARVAGYRGAMYPWESADTGEETTPRFVIDPRGRVIEVNNGEMENHITADIAYAIWQYWDVTADDGYFLRAGAEIMLETARFWASRGRIEEDGRYHIRRVIGPDEYHENVDDSVFTNIMAAWNMRRGRDTARILSERWPEHWNDLSRRLEITPEELETWARLADAMYVAFDPQTKLYEQFRGYFQLEQVDLKSYEPRSAAMDVILGHDRIQKTNVVKQADVLMAMYLLWDDFPADVREINFRYYEPRTGHGSSLSPSIHALLAARLGHLDTAARYLRQAAEIDLGNNMGNAAGGVHAAAIGGLWQAVVFGFAGVHVRREGLSFAPRLLPHWRRLTIPLEFRGRKLRLSFAQDLLRVSLEGEPLPLAIEDGPLVLARAHHDYLSQRTPDGWTSWQEVSPLEPVAAGNHKEAAP
ncbi:MAG: glycoside hydrolase family 65 protein [Terriglobales bacterium]